MREETRYPGSWWVVTVNEDTGKETLLRDRMTEEGARSLVEHILRHGGKGTALEALTQGLVSEEDAKDLGLGIVTTQAPKPGVFESWGPVVIGFGLSLLVFGIVYLVMSWIN
jgi:hypothetical protein